MVIARTVGGGDIAFLTGHAPFVGALGIATVTHPRRPSGDELGGRARRLRRGVQRHR